MKTSVLLIAGIAAVGMMASCASDNGDSPNNKGENAMLNLSLATSGTTRTTGSAISTNGDDPTKEEGTLNNLAIGLFDDGGSLVSASGKNEEKTDYKYSDKDFSQISTTSNATKIAVIANTPKVETTKLDKANTYSLFGSSYMGLLANTTSADGTSAQDGSTTPFAANSQQITGLPMYGETAVKWSTTTNNPVTVTLTRMVARVCLTSLSTDFSKYVDATATFTPTEVFMYNVKDELTNWQTGTTISSNKETNTGNGVSGICEMTERNTTTLASNAAPLKPLTGYAYLSSGSTVPAGWVAAHTPAATVTYLNCATVNDAGALSFYVFPNTDTSLPTKIIIKGIFTPTSGTPVIVYYPIVINHASDYSEVNGKNTPVSGDSEISANTIYNVQVTIKGRGVDEPYMPLEPSSVAVTMGVTAWNNTTQTVTIQ